MWTRLWPTALSVAVHCRNQREGLRFETDIVSRDSGLTAEDYISAFWWATESGLVVDERV